MFGILTGLVKVAVKTTLLPVTVAADIVTLGGELTDKRSGTYTGDMLTGIGESLEELADD